MKQILKLHFKLSASLLPLGFFLFALTLNALAEELIVKKQVSESRIVIDAVLAETTDLEEDTRFAELMNVMADINENGKTIHEMEQTEEDVIRQVANSEKIVAAKAQVVLELAKKEHFPHPILKADEEDKSFEISEMDEFSGNTGNNDEFVILYPNPNNGNMEIEYQVPEDSKSVLTIYTMEGKEIVCYNLNSKTKHTFINDSGLFSAGVYNYMLKVNDRIVVQDKLVIVK